MQSYIIFFNLQALAKIFYLDEGFTIFTKMNIYGKFIFRGEDL